MIALSITQASHSNTMVIATFWSNSFHHFGSSDAHLIPATITRIKHTTRTKETTIWDKAPIILGNALVGSVLPHFFISIQFQIIGKSVLSLIHSHQFDVVFSAPFPLSSSCAATTSHHKKLNHTNNENKPQIRYNNIFLFINLGIKSKILTHIIIQNPKKCKKNQTFFSTWNKSQKKYSEIRFCILKKLHVSKGWTKNHT